MASGFQTYLNCAQKQSGHTLRTFLALAKKEGFDASTKFSDIVVWLKRDYGLGHGHAANLAQLISKGPEVCAKRYNEGQPLNLDGE